ncbi:MAG: class I SAM-dependent methyltransferase [Candidatus Hodarchaeota archaeon]
MSDLKVYKRKVESRYDETSTEYDSFACDVMTKSSIKLLRDLDIPEDPVVLDVGCGTGISTFKMMELCENKGAFYGIDISKGMVDEARKNAKSLGYTNVSFKRGDAESLDFPDDMFDCVISNYTLHWVPDKRQAFAEMYRVLKPEG